MSRTRPVPCKTALRLPEDSAGGWLCDRLPFLGIQKIFGPDNRKVRFPVRCVQCLRTPASFPRRSDAILLVVPAMQKTLLSLSGPSLADYFSRLTLQRPAWLIFSQSSSLPAVFQSQRQNRRLRVSTSPLHENLLASRIRSILREKIQRRVSIHGVALARGERGVLLTGPSGIGKTTAALAAVREGCAWIADDLAVIRNVQDRLILTGHPRIQKYVHTPETGIISVDRRLPKPSMKKKAELAGVIDVFRTAREGISRPIETRILEKRLPLVRVGISRTGYLRRNLLRRAIQKLNEVG